MSTFSVDHDTTLVAFVAAAMPAMKKSSLKDRLRDGAVLVNGQPQTKATYALRAGDVVELRGPRPSPVNAGPGKAAPRSATRVVVLYDDADLVIIDKPSGLLTVAAEGRREETALSVTATQLQTGRTPPRLWPCHRLDKGTSGVLALAKSRAAQDAVFFLWDEASKRYVAVVDGVMRDDEGTIDAALYENPQTLSVRVSTQPNAKPARTHFRVLARGQGRTLVELAPETGRKHQIRVHLLHIGHAIVGDERYGDGSKRQRLCLHARSLSLVHPTTGARLSCEAPVPSLFFALVSNRS